jgi:hypothetical protein
MWNYICFNDYWISVYEHAGCYLRGGPFNRKVMGGGGGGAKIKIEQQRKQKEKQNSCTKKSLKKKDFSIRKNIS